MPDASILLVEDDRELRSFLTEVLEDAGYRVSAHPSGTRALQELRRDPQMGLVITDLFMPGVDGETLLRAVRDERPELNVIIITAFGSIDSAISLVKAGAFTYLTKPFETDELVLAVERALDESRLRREAAALARTATPPPGFVGASRPMQDLFETMRRFAPAALPALVTGETGTGKEVVARALHTLSGRRGSFVAVNCAALPEALLESELFGHERGAFTGAEREKRGLFEEAHQGTLFLDEVGELPRPLQPKLLRALEEGEIRRVGSNASRPVDVRVVAATNRELSKAAQEGTFREDLFWRLNVADLHVPPLRERRTDIPLLVQHFLQAAVRTGGERISVRRVTPEAMALMTAYAWPGNVRELRNVVEGAATLAAGDVLDVGDLPIRIRESQAELRPPRGGTGEAPTLRELEQEYILEVLRRTGGNRSRAAEILGLDRKTLYRKLQEYDADD